MDSAASACLTSPCAPFCLQRARERPSGASPGRERGRAASDRPPPLGGEREWDREPGRERGGGGGGHGGRVDAWEAPFPGGKRGRFEDRGGGDRFAPPPFQQGPPGGREPWFADGHGGRGGGGGERGRYDGGPRPFGGGRGEFPLLPSTAVVCACLTPSFLLRPRIPCCSSVH